MIGRLLRIARRRGAPPVRVTHYSSPEYLRARADGRGLVRVEIEHGATGLLLSPGSAGGAVADLSRPATDPSGRISSAEGFGPSPGAGTAPPLQTPGAAAEYDGGTCASNPNVND